MTLNESAWIYHTFHYLPFTVSWATTNGSSFRTPMYNWKFVQPIMVYRNIVHNKSGLKPIYIEAHWKKNCCSLPLWRRFSTDCFTDVFVEICMVSLWIPSLLSIGLLPASASLSHTEVIDSNLPFGLFSGISWTLCNERFERTEPHLATFRDTDLLRTLPARARRVALLLRGCSRLWMQKVN